MWDPQYCETKNSFLKFMLFKQEALIYFWLFYKNMYPNWNSETRKIFIWILFLFTAVVSLSNPFPSSCSCRPLQGISAVAVPSLYVSYCTLSLCLVIVFSSFLFSKPWKGCESLGKDVKALEWMWKPWKGYESLGKDMNALERIWMPWKGCESLGKDMKALERMFVTVASLW